MRKCTICTASQVWPDDGRHPPRGPKRTESTPNSGLAPHPVTIPTHQPQEMPPFSLSSHTKDINRKRCTIGRLAVVATIAHRKFLLQASEAKGENGQRSTRLHAKWGNSMQAHRELSHPSFQLDNKKGAVYLVRRNTKWETPCCVNHEEKVSG